MGNPSLFVTARTADHRADLYRFWQEVDREDTDGSLTEAKNHIADALASLDAVRTALPWD